MKTVFEIQTLCQAHKLSLMTAESCTGGLIASAITDVPGSSVYFLGGLVTYHNQLKEQLLGVSPKLLANAGAVSESCVRAMLDGLNNNFKVDCGIATSGIAGPGGGSIKKPVGLVFCGAMTPKQQTVVEKIFTGNRDEVRQKSRDFCLALFLQLLKESF